MSIASKLLSLKNTKDNIKEAIIEKGIPMDESVPFEQYSTKIASIDTGNLDVLKGYIEGTLEYVEIPEGVTVIERYSFYYFSRLKTVIMPSTVTAINDVAFSGCSELEKIDFSRQRFIPSVKVNSFPISLTPHIKFIVPDELYDEWISDSMWSRFKFLFVKKSEDVE